MAHEVTVGDKEMIKACKEALAERLGRDRFDVWFGSRVEWKIDKDSLKLYFQDDFTRDWCYRRFYGDVSAMTGLCWQAGGRQGVCKLLFDVMSAETQAVLGHSGPANFGAANFGAGPRDMLSSDVLSSDMSLDDRDLVDVSSNRFTTGISSADTKQTVAAERSVVGDSLKSRNGSPDMIAAVMQDRSVDLGGRAEKLGQADSNSGAGAATFRIVGNSDSMGSAEMVAFPGKEDKRAVESAAPIAKQRALTWENFVSGSCNKMAAATAEMILKSPGVVTPLLVYGPCGSGKTHLVQALAQRFRQLHGTRRVIYLSSEQFTNDFMEAIRGSGLPSFRRKYRDVECLILDDVQFLAGKRATLQELKHTLDTLLRQGRQVILVADRSLQELSILGPDVQARLTGGMVCPLDGLDESTRRELLGRLLAESRIKVTPKVVRELAEKSSGDARVLFGLVNRLRALSLMLRGSFNEQQALEATQDLLTACQPSIRLPDIERAVCDVCGLEPKSLQAKGKTKTVSQPRMLAMFLARKYTRAAYAEIGDYFGHRRHSTVISAERKVNEWLCETQSEESKTEVIKLRELLRNIEANLRLG